LNQTPNLYQITPQEMKKIISFDGHDSFICDSKMCEDGKLFITASIDKTVKLWNKNINTPIFSLKFDEIPNSCCFHPTNSFILLTSQNRSNFILILDFVQVWDIRNHSSYLKLINATEFSSDEENNSQSIFDVHFEKKKKISNFEPISKLMMNNQNKKKVFDKKTKSYKKQFCDHETSSKIYDIQFTSCGSYVMTASTDNYLKLWDFKNGKGVFSYNGCDLKSKCRPKLFFEDKLE
jgi:WD40 repeat protein